MKLSTKGRYGLRAFIDLAVYGEEEPVSLTNIAARQEISLNYLEQLMAKLKKAHLVELSLIHILEVKNGHIYFRVHPNVEKRYTRSIDSPAEADEAGYKVSLDMEDGEVLDIGGYRIIRRGDRICTDRTAVFAGQKDYRMQFETLGLKEGLSLIHIFCRFLLSEFYL